MRTLFATAITISLLLNLFTMIVIRKESDYRADQIIDLKLRIAYLEERVPD